MTIEGQNANYEGDLTSAEPPIVEGDTKPVRISSSEPQQEEVDYPTIIEEKLKEYRTAELKSIHYIRELLKTTGIYELPEEKQLHVLNKTLIPKLTDDERQSFWILAVTQSVSLR